MEVLEQSPMLVEINPDAIEALLRGKGWEEGDLAHELRVSTQSVRNWLQGKNRPQFAHRSRMRAWLLEIGYQAPV
jgi:DNA-binding transcriptional regulator YiaG